MIERLLSGRSELKKVVMVGDVPLSMVECVSNEGAGGGSGRLRRRVRILPPLWDTNDLHMLLCLNAIALLAGLLCFWAYTWGYPDPYVDDALLTSVLTIAYTFLGISVGLALFTVSHSFYRAEDVRVGILGAGVI